MALLDAAVFLAFWRPSKAAHPALCQALVTQQLAQKQAQTAASSF